MAISNGPVFGRIKIYSTLAVSLCLLLCGYLHADALYPSELSTRVRVAWFTFGPVQRFSRFISTGDDSGVGRA